VTGPVLEVADLEVCFPTAAGPLRAVAGVSFAVSAGETLGIVGESGSGKTSVCLAVLGLLPRRARSAGSVRLRGEELLGRSEAELRPLRGNRISIVFQDPFAALNPVLTVGSQIAEAIRVHHDVGRAELAERAVALLELVGVPSPGRRVGQYPHELSGGMRQRAMIAMAIANEPDVLIADEPTSALDVTVAAQVLEVFERVQERTATAIVLVTHDLGVLAATAHRVLVLYAGRAVELGDVEDVFYRPAHPYTQGLLGSLPRPDRRVPGGRLPRIPGQPPSLLAPPPGCAFHPRCPHAVPGLCDASLPALAPVGPGHLGSCLRAEELSDAGAPG
jgi:oligopeptide/dipeptide ABC transporter ATP-binding protein